MANEYWMGINIKLVGWFLPNGYKQHESVSCEKEKTSVRIRLVLRLHNSLIGKAFEIRGVQRFDSFGRCSLYGHVIPHRKIMVRIHFCAQVSLICGPRKGNMMFLTYQIGAVAQLVERSPEEASVGGSSPSCTTENSRDSYLGVPSSLCSDLNKCTYGLVV